MKFKLTILLLMLFQSLSFARDLAKLQEDGIRLYQQKKYNEALKVLRNALKNDNKNGKTYYYLGNVYFNLNKFKEAVECYIKAWFAKYEINNSIFNIACAYSMDNKPRKVLAALFVNYKEGDRKFARVKNDNDLANFRKTKYYKYYLKLLEILPNNGIVPKTKDDILKYLFPNGGRVSQFENNPQDPPLVYVFYKNGDFTLSTNLFADPNKTTYSWEIDERNKVFIVKEFGKYRNIKIERIPFSKIKFKILDLFTSPALYPDHIDTSICFTINLRFQSNFIPYVLGYNISDTDFEKMYMNN
jgi:tetratricopeptide (TPR) repeat protein